MKRWLEICSLLCMTSCSLAAHIYCTGIVDEDSLQINRNGTIELQLETPFDGTLIPADISLDALLVIQHSLTNNTPVGVKGFSDSADTRCHKNSKAIEFLSIDIL